MERGGSHVFDVATDLLLSFAPGRSSPHSWQDSRGPSLGSSSPGCPPLIRGLGAALGTGPIAAPLPDHSPAWVAELLGVAPTPSTFPLVLALALPPIPGKAIEKILLRNLLILRNC